MSPSKARRFVAYYRVSTERQGSSGLGIEAQQKAVRDYLNGGAWELVAEHVEIESGKRADRPELAKALEACMRHKARLVIAKLDRLSHQGPTRGRGAHRKRQMSCVVPNGYRL